MNPPRAIKPLRKMQAAASPPSSAAASLDSDTLHLAQQLLCFSRPTTPSPTKKKRAKKVVSRGDADAGKQLRTPPHKIISALSMPRMTMSPGRVPSVAPLACAFSGVNSCENIVSPEELLRQHSVRFKTVRKRWQAWHHERRKRLSRFAFKPRSLLLGGARPPPPTENVKSEPCPASSSG
ncbi:Aste57867_20895 [Aphanomyces stellatus]|uniref:Aste57867_20895 protein n=1 Tax=Aphanomyces stellatus TaxID=120398 RepID=A0A485LHC3_9STRA|nr:hypothetical protein As57867_020827 [Aphanomyces stellatus]VFT97572.1 Aste57867_20895 [Aphanomyces stellatus]